MKNIFLAFVSLFSIVSFGQTKTNFSAIDKKMDAIPASLTTATDSIAKYINANFKTENDKIRAAFYWTASNISYDVENMFVVNVSETEQDRVAKTLKNKSGICVDYAVVFNKIANATGVKAVLISGYTKINDRVVNLSHAWSAARVDNKWYLFDPTWGSGYVNSTDNKYIRKISNSFYKIEPDLMINSHMPFDYLWQFLDYTISNQEFMEGVYGDEKTKQKFDFVKEIQKHESMSKSSQFYESSQRIQKNGMKNQLISQAFIDATNRYNYEKNKESRELFEVASAKVKIIVGQYREAVKGLNNFVNYRNRQFQPLVSDVEIKNKIQVPIDLLISCKESVSTIENFGDQNKGYLEDLLGSISKSLVQADEYLRFVNLYLSKPKMVRKTMFMKNL